MNLLTVAQAMRRMRQSQNMTLDVLAEKSGFTKGYLSRLENFRVSPSLTALAKVAEVLGVPMAAFFQDEYKSPLFVRGNLKEGEEVVRDEGAKFGLRYFSLAFSKLDRVMDPFLITYSPADGPREMMMHDADEFFLVLEGKIDYYVCDMSSKVTLVEGDTIYLSKNVPHTACLASGAKSARALSIYCQPSPTSSGK